MALKIASNVSIKGNSTTVWAEIDGAYLGGVVMAEDGPLIKPYRKVFKVTTDPRDQEIADLKDSNARLADALAAAKVRAGDTYGP